jgi:TPP-dependent pyruvate/acetoin dehydrogenase alpha subunit
MIINNEKKIEMLKMMLRIRLFEEEVLDRCNAGFVPGSSHLSIGQEACAVGVIANLRNDDCVLSGHRGHSHLIAKNGDSKLMFAELYGKKTGYSKGKGGTMHMGDFKKNMFGTSGIVGGCIPISAGVGLGLKYLGSDRVATSFFGDGATNTGAFHEGLNFASIHQLPVIFIIENNQYGLSLSVKKSTNVSELAVRAKSYNIPGERVDGNDVLAVYEVANTAVIRAREGKGPSLIECLTYRWYGHWAGESSEVGALYRSEEEIEEWKKKDPVERLRKLLLTENIITENNIIKIIEEYKEELKIAVKFAEESVFPEVESLYQDVFVEEEGI